MVRRCSAARARSPWRRAGPRPRVQHRREARVSRHGGVGVPEQELRRARQVVGVPLAGHGTTRRGRACRAVASRWKRLSLTIVMRTARPLPKLLHRAVRAARPRACRPAGSASARSRIRIATRSQHACPRGAGTVLSCRSRPCLTALTVSQRPCAGDERRLVVERDALERRAGPPASGSGRSPAPAAAGSERGSAASVGVRQLAAGGRAAPR